MVEAQIGFSFWPLSPILILGDLKSIGLLKSEAKGALCVTDARRTRACEPTII